VNGVICLIASNDFFVNGPSFYVINQHHWSYYFARLLSSWLHWSTPNQTRAEPLFYSCL